MNTLKNKKVYFGRIRFALIIILILFCWSCHNNEKDDQQLLQEQISDNLLISGDIDPELLIGEWEVIKFAYTEDGNKILDVADVSKGKLSIPYAPTPIENDGNDRWRLDHSNSNLFICSLSGNLLKLELRGSSFMLSPQEEDEIVTALINAYSFVIKGNELIIFFTKVDKRNLLILKKIFNQ